MSSDMRMFTGAEKIKISPPLNECQNSTNKSNELKSYKQEKEQYLSMISEVGDLETEIYNLNVEKGRTLDELDKIEGSKVKNNQMINRRRQLEAMLLSNDRRMNDIRHELRAMKFL